MGKNVRLARVCALVLAFVALVLALCAQGFADDTSYDLKRGDRGDEVKALQEQLQFLGYYTKKIDNSFGPGMEEAVVAFNEAHGLSGKVATEDMQWLAYSDAALFAGESDEGRRIFLADIAEGTYVGTLSGDSYTNTSGTMFPETAPAQITVTIGNGQIALYSEMTASASGSAGGKETPRSPEYSVIASGTLPLRQIGNTLVFAAGDVSMLGETLKIYYDNGEFNRWEVKPRDEGATFDCTVYILMIDGVPTAAIYVYGAKSNQYCTIPLRMSGEQEPAPGAGDSIGASPFAKEPEETANALWTNRGTAYLQNNARDYYVMCELPNCTVTKLETYHDEGTEAPGELMLFGEDGSEYDPFQAEGREGPNGAQNAIWSAAVNIDLPYGRYAVADSDQATWSNNGETDGWGMATVYGVRKE